MNWILFEWKLIVRNKRLRQIFIVTGLFLPLLVYMQLADQLQLAKSWLKGIFLFKEFLFWAVFTVPATNYAVLAFSMDATFIEKLVITRESIFQLLQAKYRLYSIISIVLFILFLPSMLWGIKFIELIAALLFSIGFVSFGLFWSSLVSYKPFDIKASYFYNFQGFDASNYFFPILVLIVASGFIAFFYWLFNETITLIAMSIIGIIFIVTNKIWLGKISKSFERTKYRRLERFREI